MAKTPTGIDGFDELTRGGLSVGRATLIEGGAGSGKTVFALQALYNGAREHDRPGIFVSFEETAERIRSYARQFGWDVAGLEKRGLFHVLDAQPSPSFVQSGDFELAGLLAALDARIDAIGAQSVAIDAIDVALALANHEAAVRREIFRLHEWLLARNLTALITAKLPADPWSGSHLRSLGFMQFMVDCSIRLENALVDGISQRSLRVLKYRGSGFEANATPFLIGPGGVEVACVRAPGDEVFSASDERVSSGVEQLDEMLGGGYYRAASVLLTGAPGTAKTTLAGAFAEAACARGEKTLFVSFDSRAGELIRNLRSVRVRLEGFIDKGLLRLDSAQAIAGSSESHLLRIKALAREHGVRCLVVDPLSALAKRGNAETAHSVVERLVDWAKSEEITLFCTSLLERHAAQEEGTPLEISTIADTWVHLSYHVLAGERNRSLSIIKSRGTGHSNQVRELRLSDRGIRLEPVYTAGGEVLMGTLRWEKENMARMARRERMADAERQRRRLHAETSELEARIALLQSQLEFHRAEQAAVGADEQVAEDSRTTTEALIEARRSGHASGGAERDETNGDARGGPEA